MIRSHEKKKYGKKILPLSWDNKDALKKVVELHINLLPTSPLTGLGPIFMEKFYYSLLIKDSLIQCDYYMYGNQIVGFITYTTDPSGFLNIGIRKHLIPFCYIISAVFLRNPKKFIQLLKASQLEKAIKGNKSQEVAVLSFGVSPEYRTRKFTSETGLLISNELFEHTVKFFQNRDFGQIRLLIEPENREAIFFYMQYGCKFEKITTLGRSLVKATYYL